jgi:cell division transport system permease protein
MRRSILLAAVLTVLGLGAAGCTRGGGPDDPPPGDPQFSVFLTTDVTAAQRKGVEERLRATPDVAEVVYESKDEAYAKFRELWKDDPDFIASVEPDSLPESFRVRMTDLAAYRRTRTDAYQAELKALPGVQDVVFQCASMTECREQAAMVSAPPR